MQASKLITLKARGMGSRANHIVLVAKPNSEPCLVLRRICKPIHRDVLLLGFLREPRATIVGERLRLKCKTIYAD